MNIDKKNISLIAPLLLAITFNGYNMEPEHTESTSWVMLAGNTLIGGTTNLKQFLSYIYSGLTEQIDPFPFTDLPQDIQNSIISLLISNSSAESLKVAAQTINALAQTNHQLNNLINDPQFCLQIIWHLAEQFDCSDEVAAMALQTKESKHRLDIQMKFATLFTTQKEFKKKNFNKLYKTYKNYIDLDFSYGTQGEDSQMTLLMIAPYAKDSAIRIESLLNTGTIDINKSNTSGLTALMFSVLNSTESKAVKLLCQHSAIDINQQTLNGDTALMILCKHCNTNRFKPTNMKILLNAGADPEIANSDGLTPLKMAEENDCEEVITIIQDAIDKKNKKESL